MTNNIPLSVNVTYQLHNIPEVLNIFGECPFVQLLNRLTVQSDLKQKGLIVNPHLVFAGTDFKKVEGYGMFFRPRKTKAIMQYDEKSETA